MDFKVDDVAICEEVGKLYPEKTPKFHGGLASVEITTEGFLRPTSGVAITADRSMGEVDASL